MSTERSNDKPTDRMRRAKSEISHNRISTETLRTEFRARFFNRLRTTRSKSVDRLRQIVEDYGDNVEYRSVNDIRAVLLQDQEAFSLLKTDEVNELLNRIEQELEQVNLSKEGEEYVRTVDKETEDIVNRLFRECQVCGTICEEDNVCAHCLSEVSTEFQ